MAGADDPLIVELRTRADELCSTRGWTPIKALGAGASAAVFEVATPEGVRALKIYAPRFQVGSLGKTTRERFDIVVKHLLNHDCDTLVRCYEGHEFKDVLYMLMERVPGTCLTDVLATVPRSQIRSIVSQVACAAKYLEDRRLCHRDIKADNIVVSDDHKKATLLDLGVIRWIDSVDGAGTDDDGQLPFVATARYSSPEYMFRLTGSSPDIWRALTFYQLGGVLHDLINKHLIFEDVVQKSSQNRYLVAYAVATRTPLIKPDRDVEPDLILLAQRSLQKDYIARLSSLSWEDFTEPDRQSRREILLGIRKSSTTKDAGTGHSVAEQARALEIALDQRLTAQGIDCRHETKLAGTSDAVVRVHWSPPSLGDDPSDQITVNIDLSFTHDQLRLKFSADHETGGVVVRVFDGPVSIMPSPSPTLANDIVEHAYDAFLECSSRLVESALRERSEVAEVIPE